jgi:hypothetical protein
MKRVHTSISIFSLLILSQFLFAGGPWPQAKGEAYFKLSEWWVVFDQHYTDQALIDPNVTTGIYNTFLYGEYGLTDRLTLSLNANLFARNYTNNVISGTTGDEIFAGDALNALGDTDLSLKYGLTQPGARFPVAASLLLGIPTGQTGGGVEQNLQTGDGEFNQLLQLDAGTSFNLGDVPGYASVYSGINIRSNGFSEEFRFGGEVGISLANNKLWLVSKLAVIESFKNGDTAANNTSTSIFANNTEFASLALEVNYYITEKIGLSANYTGALRGEIIAAAPSYSVGVFVDLRK